jgi:hypothetical protein
MKKNIVAVVVACISLFTLSGCGKLARASVRSYRAARVVRTAADSERPTRGYSTPAVSRPTVVLREASAPRSTFRMTPSNSRAGGLDSSRGRHSR